MSSAALNDGLGAHDYYRFTDRGVLDSTALKGGNADASALAEMQYKVTESRGEVGMGRMRFLRCRPIPDTPTGFYGSLASS